MAVFFMATTGICAVGWLIKHISVLALVYYIEKKGYTQPNNQEIRECTQWAAKKVFKLS